MLLLLFLLLLILIPPSPSNSQGLGRASERPPATDQRAGRPSKVYCQVDDSGSVIVSANMALKNGPEGVWLSGPPIEFLIVHKIG